MQELIQQIMAKVGISSDQASSTVEVVMDFLKNKLPGPMATQLEGILKGSGSGESGSTNLGDIADKVKGLMGS